MTVSCPNCGKPVRQGAKYCANCRAELPANLTANMPQNAAASPGGTACPKCGTMVRPGGRFCPKCGAAQATDTGTVTNPPRSQAAPVPPSPAAPTGASPTPVTPTPVAPTPVAPTPVGPTPVGPTPVGPTPAAPRRPARSGAARRKTTSRVLLGLAGVALLCCIGAIAAVLLRGYLPERIQALIPVGAQPTAVEEAATEAAPSPTASMLPEKEATGTATPEMTQPADTTTVAPTMTPPAETPAAVPTTADPVLIATITPSPDPTTQPAKTGTIIEDDFCNVKQTTALWTMSVDPEPQFRPPEAEQCLLEFTATNEKRSRLLLNDPVEIKEGTEIEFLVQLDAAAPQDLMIFRWYPGTADPADDAGQGNIDVEIGNGRIRSSITTGAEGLQDSSEKKLDGAEVHAYKIEVEDGLKIVLKKDGEELTTFDEPLYLEDTIGRLIFIGKGQLRSVKVTVP